MSKARFFLVVLVFSLVACGGPTPSSDDGSGSGGAANTGGASAAGGGSATGGTSAVATPVPTGPGLEYDASLGTFCPQYDCVERPSSGIYTVVERCDETGTWADPSCPTAQFTWTVVSASGQIEFGFQSSVDTTVAVSWTVQYPASCGGCDVQSELTGWIDVSCTPNSDSSCSCTGKSVAVSKYKGTVTLADGSAWIVENATPETAAAGIDPPRHLFEICASADGHVTEYDGYGAHMYLQAQ